MTDTHTRPLGHDEARARDAVRALPRPEADAGFRERLRSEFASGRIEAAHPRLAGGGRARRAVVWLAAPVAAAALLLAVSVLNQGPRWRVTAVSGEGIAVVDRRAVPLGHVEELARRIHAGAEVEWPAGASIEITSPGALAVEIEGETLTRVPTPPGRWFGREVAAGLSRGELRITTGPAFRGARLVVRTPEASVEVVGTTLGVICEPQGTCVCVLEGRVRVGPLGGAMAAVEQGRLRYTFRDGRPPVDAEMRPVERVELARLRLRHRADAPARSGPVQ
ncbi:MAG: hypothetical protein A2W00_01960 [Candidatus Eisenbacteria bacterium RBG_16_71_46]|nr:MAG: hypothetical protein A2W00_01960 [Candidatus Eisenbacteria bacterium RBG_16_71_46]OGF22177.1 MAG: hypothetical protein A2V63_02465 [Candidatus Eisenbacteria bacterium RBG_19FT_COMBO_70_11]